MKLIKTNKTLLDKVNELLSGNIAYYTGSSNADGVVIDIEELRYQKVDNNSMEYDDLIQIVDVMPQDEWVHLHL